ncbi:MAG: hypothetical protein O3B01_00795 [Planctomycetota bacterium]|nr:hypothetical protein [Planctomycetota bacterium]MDA1137091.1 hypothetical protein [Planctomycetota bacterium]
MNTLDDIQAALPNLSINELYSIERSIHDIYRKRHAEIIYDDSHGVWTEDDQVSAAAQVFSVMEAQEEARADGDT